MISKVKKNQNLLLSTLGKDQLKIEMKKNTIE